MKKILAIFNLNSLFQACLPHLVNYPDQVHDLVVSILPNIVQLGQHACGTFFLQKLINIMALGTTNTTAGFLVLNEEILKKLPQLVVTEPGSRLIIDINSLIIFLLILL